MSVPREKSEVKAQQKMWSEVLSHNEVFACTEAKEWVHEQLKTHTPEEVYNSCRRASWLEYIYDGLTNATEGVGEVDVLEEKFWNARQKAFAGKLYDDNFKQRLLVSENEWQNAIQMRLTRHERDVVDDRRTEEGDELLFEYGFLDKYRLPFAMIETLAIELYSKLTEEQK